MDKTIWKFPLTVKQSQWITVPSDAKALSIDVQSGIPCLWMLLDPDESMTAREIHCVGTGQGVGASHDQFIGTVLVGAGVWHYFWGERAYTL
jgi:hypothetical protein